MVGHKKSLLDAFTASAPEGRAAVKRKSVAPPAAGGPFAPVSHGAKRSIAMGELGEAPRKSLFVRAMRDRTIQLVTLGAVVALGAAYWFQRPVEASPGTDVPLEANVAPGAFARTPEASSDATPPTVPNAAGADDVARTNREAAQLGTAEDQAFHDPKNLCTVRVAQYKNDENGLKLARATVAWLRKEGYPAVQPIRTGDGKALIVCVGAKPKAKDLETLVEFVHGLRGPPPQPKQSPFRDAYVVNIDDVLKRR